ncbi:MAG: PD40 domain-containing protein [Prolixibacteraceae bacterium]|nr:PD40 domain-containing protein [Prolixibacteraceae bacterium]MBN2773725.1 PD40 domain-containing protein [Prolixibacteraceae bacterium]
MTIIKSKKINLFSSYSFILILIVVLSCKENEDNVNFDIEPVSPYDNPIWHPSGEVIGFNHIPIQEIHYNFGYDRPGMATYIYNEDSIGFWLINADGTDQRIALPYLLYNPLWSPDGKWITFVQKGQTFKMSFNGNHFDTTSIAPMNLNVGDYIAAWSPNCKQIAYASYNNTQSNGLWIKNLETGTNKFIDSYGRSPSWHPNTDVILYLKENSFGLYNYTLESSELFLI